MKEEEKKRLESKEVDCWGGRSISGKVISIIFGPSFLPLAL